MLAISMLVGCTAVPIDSSKYEHETFQGSYSVEPKEDGLWSITYHGGKFESKDEAVSEWIASVTEFCRSSEFKVLNLNDYSVGDRTSVYIHPVGFLDISIDAFHQVKGLVKCDRKS